MRSDETALHTAARRTALFKVVDGFHYEVNLSGRAPTERRQFLPHPGNHFSRSGFLEQEGGNDSDLR